MRRHRDAHRPRRPDDPRQLLLRERGPDRAAAHGGVGVDLDPVGPAADLVAHDPDQRIDPVGLLGALRDVPLGGEALGRVAARRHDRPGHDQHPRTRHDPLFDGLLDPHVGVSRPLRAQVADRREAGEERAPQVVGRATDPQGQGLLQDLVVPQRLIIRVEQHVRMQVDEARQERPARQLDRASPVGRLDLAGRTGGLDPIAADDDRPALVRLGVDPVEHPRRLEHDRLRRAGPRAAGSLRRSALGPRGSGHDRETRETTRQQ